MLQGRTVLLSTELCGKPNRSVTMTNKVTND